MIRLAFCVVALGGVIAFLSCSSPSSDPTGGGGGGDGKGPAGGQPGSGGHGVSGGSDGRGSGGQGSGGSRPTGDGSAPIGTGGRGVGGINWGDGAGPIGTGGRGVGGINWGDGAGPVGGKGGTGGAQACDGLPYFVQAGLCASTYAVQSVKIPGGYCNSVTVLQASCRGTLLWSTKYKGLGDPVLCAYDSTGNLVGARVCTDTPKWNCNGAAQASTCLNGGAVPDIGDCPLTDTCANRGDGSGPIGGHGGH